MKTPESIKDFLTLYHNNNPNDWLFQKREVIEKILSEYASQFTPKKESKTIEERREIFNDSILEFINDYPSLMLGEFFHYWSEHSVTSKKMRFEKEKVFDIKKRLERWNKNQKTFNNGKPTKQTRHDKFESAFNRADENSGTVETFDKV